MDDLSFLQDANKGHFRVIIHGEGSIRSIDSLDTSIIGKGCPGMLSAAAHSGDDTSYTFENKSAEAVISLLRHVYLDDYTYCEAGLERPCSLAFHFRVFQLARMLHMEALQEKVYFYIFEETQRFHETKLPVHEFYEGIIFLYLELRDCKDVRDMIANYCVNRFAHFRFHEKEIFRQIAFESPLFHKDLQQANHKAGFDNEAAMEIVQLPVCEHNIHPMSVDFACHLHSPTTEDGGATTPTQQSMAKPATPESMAASNKDGGLTLRTKLQQIPVEPSTSAINENRAIPERTRTRTVEKLSLPIQMDNTLVLRPRPIFQLPESSHNADGKPAPVLQQLPDVPTHDLEGSSTPYKEQPCTPESGRDTQAGKRDHAYITQKLSFTEDDLESPPGKPRQAPDHNESVKEICDALAQKTKEALAASSSKKRANSEVDNVSTASTDDEWTKVATSVHHSNKKMKGIVGDEEAGKDDARIAPGEEAGKDDASDDSAWSVVSSP